jgi:hypothetical protein
MPNQESNDISIINTQPSKQKALSAGGLASKKNGRNVVAKDSSEGANLAVVTKNATKMS